MLMEKAMTEIYRTDADMGKGPTTFMMAPGSWEHGRTTTCQAKPSFTMQHSNGLTRELFAGPPEKAMER